MSASIRERYGPWALVAGASEGLGAAFAEKLAADGLSLLLVARTTDRLTATAQDLRDRYGVEVRTLALDLGGPDVLSRVEEATHDLDVGLLVYNAAASTIGPFLEQPLERHIASARVNCEGPLVLSWLLGRAMAARGRGGIVLMTSLAAFQGSALLATYAATKAFNLVLAEGLWDELRAGGVDVLASCAGATRTPRYLATNPQRPGLVAVPEIEPSAVVRETLAALGRRPSLIPGWVNRLATFAMRRLMPRWVAVRLMGRTTRAIYPP